MPDAPARASGRLALSVDLEEWFHSGRWLDPRLALGAPQVDPRGSACAATGLSEATRVLLDLAERYGCRLTFFVLGQVAESRPELVRELAARGHEVAHHGQRHADMTTLGPQRFEAELAQAAETLERLSGRRPRGYRAPNLVYEPWATRALERQGFIYDSSVCAARPLGGKYHGYAQAPSVPYHPDYAAVGRVGGARLVELPLPSFPLLKVAAGSGIVMRVFGAAWIRIALWSALRRGDTGFYLHPWELGPRPPRRGSRLKNAVFLRRTGPWMQRQLERLLRVYAGRVATCESVARAFLAREATPTRPPRPRPPSTRARVEVQARQLVDPGLRRRTQPIG